MVQPKSAPAYHRVTITQLDVMFRLRGLGKTQQEIADVLGVAVSTVNEHLQQLTDTRELAKGIAKAAAAPLTERVIAQADVDQALEVLDRLDVLPKRIVDSHASSINIMIGMPGHPAGPDPFDLDASTVVDATQAIDSPDHLQE